MNILKSFFVILFLMSGLMSFILKKRPLTSYESTFGANKPQYKFDYITENRKAYLIEQKKLIEERHRQKKQQLNQEKERKIYRKYLASRSTSSFLKDFHTMRY